MKTTFKDFNHLNLPISHHQLGHLLRAEKVNWRSATDEEVLAALAARKARQAEARKQQRPPRKALEVTVDGVTHTAPEWAKKCGVAVSTLLRRIELSGDAEGSVRRSLAHPGPWDLIDGERRPYKPRSGGIVIGEWRATVTEWARACNVTRQWLWALAKRNGRTIQQEIEARVLTQAPPQEAQAERMAAE